MMSQLERELSMKEESMQVMNQKWVKGEKEPFEGGKQKFSAVPKEERSDFIKKMLEIKQNPSPPPVLYIKEYRSSGKFKYQDYNLHYHAYEQTQNPKAIFIHLHGLNSHGQSSGYLASVITAKNPEINCYSFDQMNFGQSEGPYRGEIRSFEDSVSQTQTFIEFLLGKFTSKPKVFLCGTSYGGSISFKTSLKNPQKIHGIVFLAPALKNLSERQAFMKGLGKCIGFICPRMRLFKGTTEDSTKFNQDERIKTDPYYYNDGLVPGSVRTILNAMDEISQQFKELKTPYIIFQAGVDKMVDPFAPLDLQESCQSTDKTTIYCENMWHSVLAEDEIEGIAWKTAEWLKERI